MRKTLVWISSGVCILSLGVFAWAQSARKPGLWETTTTMTFQQSPMPPGMQAPPGSPFAGGPRTTQVCLTQAILDKYGAPPPVTRGDCQVANIVMKATGMTATLTCTGRTVGSGTVETTWTEPGQARSKVHFTGTLQMGANSRPIEWTSEAVSAYKGPDCGSVQPPAMAANP